MTASITLYCDRLVDKDSVCAAKFYSNTDNVVEARRRASHTGWGRMANIERRSGDACPTHRTDR